MADILIRGLKQETVVKIDREARALGLSRNEFLRRRLEQWADASDGEETLTDEAWKRSAEVFADLSDPELMATAWQ